MRLISKFPSLTNPGHYASRKIYQNVVGSDRFQALSAATSDYQRLKPHVMPYDVTLADKVREYLAEIPGLEIQEKKMFRGLCFMVNGKMCINVSGENLMCRFDPDRYEELAAKTGFEPMIMNGKQYAGYCYVNPAGFRLKKDFEFWIKTCLDFNARAKAYKRSKKKAKTK